VSNVTNSSFICLYNVPLYVLIKFKFIDLQMNRSLNKLSCPIIVKAYKVGIDNQSNYYYIFFKKINYSLCWKWVIKMCIIIWQFLTTSIRNNPLVACLCLFSIPVLRFTIPLSRKADFFWNICLSREYFLKKIDPHIESHLLKKDSQNHVFCIMTIVQYKLSQSGN
jgi:hypothetical protein